VSSPTTSHLSDNKRNIVGIVVMVNLLELKQLVSKEASAIAGAFLFRAAKEKPFVCTNLAPTRVDSYIYSRRWPVST
jgi:hypothetical protein